MSRIALYIVIYKFIYNYIEARKAVFIFLNDLMTNDLNDYLSVFFSKNEWCGKGRTKVMKRKRKRWVKTKNVEKEEKGKTKDAEKHEKEEEKIGEGRKKQWLRGSFNGKIVPLCLDMCLLAQEQWKTYFKPFRKKENRWIIKMMTNNQSKRFWKFMLQARKKRRAWDVKDRERALESLCYM